ncbi:MAG: FHA domain-containing protein [Symploca sp. SIO2E6]|nr:FHA domain-containing protein [Symploca sp. SIO2E6]
MQGSIAQLKIFQHNISRQEFLLTHDLVTIGRALDNSLVLNDDLSVSRHHAQITREKNCYVLTDLRSSDGTSINGTKLSPHTPQPLAESDLIRIGSFELRFHRQSTAQPTKRYQGGNHSVTQLVSPNAPQLEENQQSQELDLRNCQVLTIGRDSLNDMVIDYPTVSRFHAQIKRQNGSFVLFNLNSTNGTFVNGKQVVAKKILRVGDTISIGPYDILLKINETLIGNNQAGNLRLDAMNLKKMVCEGVNLLNDISLSIEPREFVAIAGVSGGGKSTLLDALNGFRPATSGTVLVNGHDLYRHFNAYRTEIGYVPQKDIVHLELTVEQALNYAAQLRMPADTTKAERRKRVDEVLEDLGLSHRRQVPVKTLSGGQLKRVSIGVELLTKPSLFFLDEATSGLDPGTEAELMQLLRQLADQGRTILLITHATENVMLCNLVVFMAKGGNLAYFGPPQEAPQYFGVQRFNEIYRKLENELSPEEWQQRYLESPQYQQYVVQRQQSLVLPTKQQPKKRPRTQLPGAVVKRISSWRQFLILSQRNLAILIRDRASLILMLAVAPILGLLDFFAWNQNLFDVQTGDAKLAITMLFTTGLIAVMVGSIATMREIVKELDIYRRERIIGLKIIPYILSKVWVSVLLALYQAAIFLAFKFLAVDIPVSVEIVVGMYITLVLATIAGMVMGLLGSAISPNQNVAPLIAIIFLVPQIIFGGGVLPVDTFGPPGQLINQISLTKWSFETLVTITGLGKDVASDSCWNLPEEQREQLSDGEKEQCACYGVSIFKTCKFPGIKEAYEPAVDEPEPIIPNAPGKPPQLSATPSPLAQQNYQNEIAAYQKKIDEYFQNIDQWQQKYTNWKEKYEGAIGKAEAIISSFHKDYGATFNVNVTRHWSILCSLIAGMFSLIVVAQKRKDIL